MVHPARTWFAFRGDRRGAARCWFSLLSRWRRFAGRVGGHCYVCQPLAPETGVGTALSPAPRGGDAARLHDNQRDDPRGQRGRAGLPYRMGFETHLVEDGDPQAQGPRHLTGPQALRPLSLVVIPAPPDGGDLPGHLAACRPPVCKHGPGRRLTARCSSNTPISPTTVLQDAHRMGLRAAFRTNSTL